jgi:membrane protein involved in colicin uptake
LLLLENTERLISQFEAEQQAREAQARAWQEHQQQLQQEQLALQEQQRRAEAEHAAAREAARREAERRRPPTAAEIASVEGQAKAIVKATYGVDLDAPGWRGLVLKHVRELLGK